MQTRHSIFMCFYFQHSKVLSYTKPLTENNYKGCVKYIKQLLKGSGEQLSKIGCNG